MIESKVLSHGCQDEALSLHEPIKGLQHLKIQISIEPCTGSQVLMSQLFSMCRGSVVQMAVQRHTPWHWQMGSDAVLLLQCSAHGSPFWGCFSGGLTSKLVHIQYPGHVCSHDVFWEPVISLQQPGIVLLNQLSVLCICPEPVLPSCMHLPVARIILQSVDGSLAWKLPVEGGWSLADKAVVTLELFGVIQTEGYLYEMSIDSLHSLLPAPEFHRQRLHLP